MSLRVIGSRRPGAGAVTPADVASGPSLARDARGGKPPARSERPGSSRRTRKLGSWLALASLFFAGSARAACTLSCSPATQCTCVPDAADCNITSPWTVPPGTMLDCSGMNVHITNPTGKITVDGGFVRVRARDLTIDATQSIEATTSQSVRFGIVLSLTGQLSVTGYLSANSAFGGGQILVAAAGPILLPTSADVKGMSANGVGGTEAAGGSIDLQSLGNIVTDDPLIADGSTVGVSTGGQIALRGASITVRDNVSAQGHNTNAGAILLKAPDGTIDIQSTLKVEGTGVDGNGGAIELAANQITLSAPLSAQGGVGTGGGQSNGGSVLLEAGAGGVAINADVDVTGGAAGSGLDGGAIMAESEGTVTVASGVSLLTKSDAHGGNGGDIRLVTQGALTIAAATLDARGDWIDGQGQGAAIELSGCAVSIGAGATLDARGYHGGSVVLTGHHTLTVSASSGTAVDATGNGGTAGSTTLRYRVTGTCSGNPALECGFCRGSCSNDVTRTCAIDPDCTVGCTTGQCESKQCTESPNAVCTEDAECSACGASGPCTPNPNTGGGTSQFHPAPVMSFEPNLPACF